MFRRHDVLRIKIIQKYAISIQSIKVKPQRIIIVFNSKKHSQYTQRTTPPITHREQEA